MKKITKEWDKNKSIKIIKKAVKKMDKQKVINKVRKEIEPKLPKNWGKMLDKEAFDKGFDAGRTYEAGQRFLVRRQKCSNLPVIIVALMLVVGIYLAFN